jgi:hypothetical protein
MSSPSWPQADGPRKPTALDGCGPRCASLVYPAIDDGHTRPRLRRTPYWG